ncbi:MAG: HNH endonuclease signature motif containing protein [Bacillota bacterium]
MMAYDYTGARHREWRKKVLRRAGGLCQECKRYGRRTKDGQPVPATHAHHKKPVEQYPELVYVVENGEALCEACHNKRHPEKGGRRK